MAHAQAPKKTRKREKVKSSRTIRAKSKVKPKHIQRPTKRRSSEKQSGKSHHNMSDKRASKHQIPPTPANQAVTETPPRGSLTRPLPLEPAPRLLRDTKTTAAALAMLERGIKQLYQKEYKKARAELKSLIEAHPAESEIVAKAKSYIQICDREEESHKKHTVSNDQLYALGVMEHNRGNYEGAISYFRQSLEKNREAEYVYYSLAASLAQKGEASEAIQALRRAIELNRANQIFAKNDQDFDPLHASREFADLVGMTQTGGATLLSQS